MLLERSESASLVFERRRVDFFTSLSDADRRCRNKKCRFGSFEITIQFEITLRRGVETAAFIYAVVENERARECVACFNLSPAVTR